MLKTLYSLLYEKNWYEINFVKKNHDNDYCTLFHWLMVFYIAIIIYLEKTTCACLLSCKFIAMSVYKINTRKKLRDIGYKIYRTRMP